MAQTATELLKVPAREDREPTVVLVPCLGQLLARAIDCASHLSPKYEPGRWACGRFHGSMVDSDANLRIISLPLSFILLRYDGFTFTSHPRYSTGYFFGLRFEEPYHCFDTCLGSYRISMYVVCK